MEILSVSPPAAIPHGVLDIQSVDVPVKDYGRLKVTCGSARAHVLLLRPDLIRIRVPENASGGEIQVWLDDEKLASAPVVFGQAILKDIHAVDNPVIDQLGYVYTTFSGQRDDAPAVSVFRVAPDGHAENYITAVRNATSMALDEHDTLYISSRFEGQVYKVLDRDQLEIVASNLGAPFGLAFNPSGTLFIGDRQGRILQIPPGGEPSVFIELTPSPIAYHLAFDPEGNLFISAPDLAHDEVFMVDPYGHLIPFYTDFGRPQGLSFDKNGNLYIAKGHAMDGGIYRISTQGEMQKILAGPPVLGLAFDANGNTWINTSNTLYRVPLGIYPLAAKN